jgi:DNA-binding NtrC family response regulator
LASARRGLEGFGAPREPHPAGTKVLVVEDDSLLRAVTVCSLEELGVAAMGAATASEALAVLADNTSIEVLMTDVRLPGMSGRALAAEVGRRWPGVRVLFATGEEEAETAAPSSMPHLHKPYSVEQLADALERVGVKCGGA